LQTFIAEYLILVISFVVNCKISRDGIMYFVDKNNMDITVVVVVQVWKCLVAMTKKKKKDQS